MRNRCAYPATLLADFYKISHRDQYLKGTECVYSTWIPRSSRIPGVDNVVAFGFQAFVKEYLIKYFNENFFSRPLHDVVAEYQRVIKHTLGIADPDASHLEALWNLNYLPVRIKAVKEGTLVPLRVPMLTIENTRPEFFWLTNYLETIMSSSLWVPSTSATIAFEYRKILEKYAMETAGNLDAVPFQGHDFSFRGIVLEAAKLSGMGHLLSFVGTDTIPAILATEDYYGANIETELIGCSIPATEHSVMEVYGKDELAAYRHLMTEVYPEGFLSIVSDTWDLWKVLTDVITVLKPEIMARYGKIVVRPDSGDPVKIVCGDPDSDVEIVRKGVIEYLWDTFGGTITEKGYKLLDTHIGVIYGEAITLPMAVAICEKLKERGFASINLVYGIGSFTYQYNTRDTFGFALKSTAATVNGEEIKLYKDPVTDTSHIKKSLCGRAVVVPDCYGTICVIDNLNAAEQKLYNRHSPEYLQDLLEDVFVDGKLVRDEKFSDIRARLLRNLR